MHFMSQADNKVAIMLVDIPNPSHDKTAQKK